eukprot:5079297-Lingulodinium_polyedra.AAC.1
MPWGFAFLVALALGALRAPRLSLGVLLQQQRGLRPSEMLGLHAGDIALPEAMAFGRRTAAV